MNISPRLGRISLTFSLLACGCADQLVPFGPIVEVNADPSASPPEITIPEVPPPLCAVPDRGLSLCINEVQSNNDATFQPAGPGEFPDWFELYNAGTVPIDPATVAVEIGDAAQFLLDGDPIAPGEVRLVVTDGISNDGERLAITVYDLLSDEIEVPALASDTLIARVPDGGLLQRTCTGSPGLANADAGPCDDPREWVFSLDRIHEFRLYLDPTAWAALETSSTFVHVPAPGRLVFAGGEFPAVEVELKGGYGSFRGDLDSQKSAFKLDLDAYAEHDWHSLDRLTLNNMVQDPTFTHEYLTYALYREVGVPAPRVGYARVYVNDVPFGFYSLVEPIDGDFLEQAFGDASGHLFESAYGPDFDLGEEALFEYDHGPDVIAGQALLAEVSTLLATSPWDETTYGSLKTLVDMDGVMRNMAVEAAAWHWDGYTTENNYYLYRDPTTSQWTMMPHGTDQTWVDGWPNAFDWNDRSVLYQFCLAVPSCLATYDQAVLDVADALDRLALEPTLDELIVLTEPEFAADPRKEESTDWPGQLVTTRVRIQTAAQALRDAAGIH